MKNVNFIQDMKPTIQSNCYDDTDDTDDMVDIDEQIGQYS